MLAELLGCLSSQITADMFTFSVVVVDNDSLASARPVVDFVMAQSPLRIEYRMELDKNIAKARNRAVSGNGGDYTALIDDDELPGHDWLLMALQCCARTGADGVLGPVNPRFAVAPADWIMKSGLHDRPNPPTGTVLHWRECRTGNVLMRATLTATDEQPFDPSFGNGSEDKDFFRRTTARGARFVWCREAPVHESVPAERCTRSYLIRRALLRGQNEARFTTAVGAVKSLVAVPLYLAVLPVCQLAGHHHFMRRAVSLCDHVGKLMALVGVKPLGNRYVH
jgi:glycosyltransferase involved in cell wall biosynthesis